jgi:YHS domain-containing protein
LHPEPFKARPGGTLFFLTVHPSARPFPGRTILRNQALMKASILSLLGAALLAVSLSGLQAAPAQKATCIVSGQEIEVTDKTAKSYVQGKPVYFCCDKCPAAFAKNPEKFVKNVGDCPVLGTPVSAPKASERVVVNNGLWYLCCASCADQVGSNPTVLKQLEDVVSHKTFKVTSNSPRSDYKEQTYLFENAENKAVFDKDPAKFAVVYAR